MTDALQALAALATRDGAALLDDAALARRMAALTGWAHDHRQLVKSFRFDSYGATILFVNALAFHAERMNHHPDLEVGYGRCRVAWGTHDAGGVTDNDCIAAARTELLLR